MKKKRRKKSVYVPNADLIARIRRNQTELGKILKSLK